MPSSRLEPRHGVADSERGAYRPLGVVVVRHWRAEHCHDTVTDVLVDAATETLDQAIGQREEAVGQLVGRLGAELAGSGG